ncbi:hypothetical protein, partial [Escherichia coli]|uniref:hypothetical protein n=1 Tax=Escherichia coli TaxID=562 RepID=UPI001952D8B7
RCASVTPGTRASVAFTLGSRSPTQALPQRVGEPAGEAAGGISRLRQRAREVVPAPVVMVPQMEEADMALLGQDVIDIGSTRLKQQYVLG